MTVEFGLALENFTPERKVPDMDAITAYSATAGGWLSSQSRNSRSLLFGHAAVSTTCRWNDGPTADAGLRKKRLNEKFPLISS